MSGYLSARPVGIRKSWRRVEFAPAEADWCIKQIGETYMPMAARIEFELELAEIIEAHYFKDRGGRIRRVEIAFSNGRMVSRRWHKRGNIIQFKPLPGAGLKLLQSNTLEKGND